MFFYFIKSETSDSFVNHFDGHFAYLKTLDFYLNPSPINSALYVVIVFVLVCLCRFLWQIILLTYTSYKSVAHFDLSWLRSISG